MNSFGMNSFDEWLDKNNPGTVLRDGVELLDADLSDMKAAYNAGMERAAEIADTLRNSCKTSLDWGSDIGKAIRKETT